MRLPIAAAVVLAATLRVPAAAAAQAPEIPLQSRVRVVLTRQPDVEGYTPPQVLRGTLLALDADSMTLRLHPGTGPIRVARSVVRRVDVSRGVPSRPTSAAMGAVGGAVFGAIYFWAFNDEEFDSGREAALTGAGAGALTGLVAGALWPRERWHRVRLPARVTVAPTAEGALLGFTIAR